MQDISSSSISIDDNQENDAQEDIGSANIVISNKEGIHNRLQSLIAGTSHPVEYWSKKDTIFLPQKIQTHYTELSTYYHEMHTRYNELIRIYTDAFQKANVHEMPFEKIDLAFFEQQYHIVSDHIHILAYAKDIHESYPLWIERKLLNTLYYLYKTILSIQRNDIHAEMRATFTQKMHAYQERLLEIDQHLLSFVSKP